MASSSSMARLTAVALFALAASLLLGSGLVSGQDASRPVSGTITIDGEPARSGGAVQVVGFIRDDRANLCASLPIIEGGRFEGAVNEAACTSGGGDDFRYRFRYIAGDLSTMIWLTPDVSLGTALEGLALSADTDAPTAPAPQIVEALPRNGDGSMARRGGSAWPQAATAAGVVAVVVGGGLATSRIRR